MIQSIQYVELKYKETHTMAQGLIYGDHRQWYTVQINHANVVQNYG